jgi:hypothetical protein
VPRSSRCKDLVDIVKAMSVASAAFVVALVLLGLTGFPRSIIAIDWLASITAPPRCISIVPAVWGPPQPTPRAVLSSGFALQA